ncbi:MAG: hypothetical protein WDN31_00495 [Hyphomicrobium sp.]
MFPYGNNGSPEPGESRYNFPLGNIGEPGHHGQRDADQDRREPDSACPSRACPQGGSAKGVRASALRRRECRRRTGAAVRARWFANGAKLCGCARTIWRWQPGSGRRFILELEAGKASCQLGRALVVAAAVGLRPLDLMSANNGDDDALLPQLRDDAPDLPELGDDERG